MSIILDTLRRGRGKATSQRGANTAQTDAVLQTLGHGKASVPPVNRMTQIMGYLLAAVAGTVMLWFAVVWVTQAYLTRDRARASAAAAANPDRMAPHSRYPEKVTAPTGSTAAEGPGPAESTSPPEPPIGVTTTRRGQEGTAPERRFSGTGPSTTYSTSSVATHVVATAGDDDFDKALYYQRIGDVENALVYYKQVLQQDDLNAQAHNNLGVLYRDQRLLTDAANEFRRAITIDPKNPRPRNNLGVVYLIDGKLDDAAAEFRTALAIDPRNVASLVNLSTTQKEAGNRDAARHSLDRALELDPKNAEAHYNLGLLEDVGGNQNAALMHYRAFMQVDTGHAALVGDVRKRAQTLEGRK